MKIEILGCSGGIGHGLKTTTFLVDDSLLLDAGTGIELLKMDQMLAIRDVVITHAHIDHIIGLPLMLATIYDQHEETINVYALPDVIEALESHIFNWTIWPDYTKLPENKPIVSLHKINVGEKLTLQGKSIEALPAEHPTPTIGYFISKGKSSFAFTGDTGINDQLWPILNQRKPDTLIIDVSFTDEVDELAKLSGHLTPSHLSAQLKKFSHPARVLITHLKPGFEDTIMQQCRNLLPDWQIDRLHHDDLITI
ncbi:MAG: MBL fold metallo-hydrolase [Neptuniibacter sp.]